MTPVLPSMLSSQSELSMIELHLADIKGTVQCLESFILPMPRQAFRLSTKGWKTI